MITTNALVTLEKRISESLYLLSLRPEKRVRTLPGTFLQLSLEQKNASEPWLDARAFSIASWGRDDLKILVRREGSFTSSLVQRSIGNRKITIKYPLGRFLIIGSKYKVFLAGGVGISVFMSYIDYLEEMNKSERIVLFHSVREESELFSSIYWRDLPRSMVYVPFVSRGAAKNSISNHFLIGDLDQFVNLERNCAYYVSGPVNFTQYWVEALRNRNIDSKTEKWINRRG